MKTTTPNMYLVGLSLGMIITTMLVFGTVVIVGGIVWAYLINTGIVGLIITGSFLGLAACIGDDICYPQHTRTERRTRHAKHAGRY